MHIAVGDALGYVHLVNCDTKAIQRLNHFHETEGNGVTTLLWKSRGSKDGDLIIGREGGYVESRKLTNSVADETVQRSIRLPAPVIHLSLIQPGTSSHSAAYPYRCNKITYPLTHSDKTLRGTSNGKESCKSSLKRKAASTVEQQCVVADATETVKSRLLCISKEGHACVVPWGDPTERTGEFEALPVSAYKPINNSHGGSSEIRNSAFSDAIIEQQNSYHLSGAATSVKTFPSTYSLYRLPSPIECAATNPLVTNYTAFAGLENDVKVWDVGGESILWSAKNVKRTSLDLRVPVDVTALRWLPATDVNVLAATTHNGNIRIYDIRVQRRPVYEESLTQEHRRITACCGWSNDAAGKGKGSEDTDKKRFNIAGNAHIDEWIATHRKGLIATYNIYCSDTYGMLYKHQIMSAKAQQQAEGGTTKETQKRKPNSGETTDEIDSSATESTKYHTIAKGNLHNQMGASTAVDVSSDGKHLLSVSLGRYATVYDTQTRKVTSKIYLKQKLTSCVFTQSQEEPEKLKRKSSKKSKIQ